MLARRPRNTLLAILLMTSTVVTLALVWFGVKSLQQTASLEKQQASEQLERTADAFASGVKSRLAEAGQQLSDWISTPASPLPHPDDSVVAAWTDTHLTMVPDHALPFVPGEAPIPSPDKIFAEAEAAELSPNQISRSAEMYRALSRNPEPHIRAEALLRLGRVQRKQHDFEAAAQTYRALQQMRDATAGGLPAELAGLDGERSTFAAAGDHVSEQHVTVQIARSIDAGLWPLTRGAAEFYRDGTTRDPKPESWHLAAALALLWDMETKEGSSAGSLRVLDGDGQAVIAIWRSNGPRSAALVSFVDRFFARSVPADYAYQLADAGGQRIAGAAAAPAQPSVRIIGDPQHPLLLRFWPASPNVPASRGGSRFLLAMLTVVILFLWGAVYFMARAIRREAGVSRLQSDFVAAVSHEFRSPLTTVRQLAEMLEMGQVPSDDRRQKYYRVLAAESRRLQRLVETLLNFGKMEAGAGHFRFEKLDVCELVSRAVREVSGEESEAAARIRVDGDERHLHLMGDADALTLALRNLLENGLKYSPSSEPVEVTWRDGDGRVAISVVDHGPGIPQDEQERIFQKFVRGRAAIEASIKGTGLGLAMVRHILSAHGGEIKLESEPGRGSTFTILLSEAS